MKTPTPDSATILLVDDEDAVQKLLTYPLEHEGFRVLQARDGEEALRQFGQERVDLVVLDLMLPKLDGLEVCRRLRGQSTVPIIMLTARDDELDKVVGLELGADDYITKPFSIREFRSRVRALLRRAALGSQADGRDVIGADGLEIDLARRTVDVRGRPVELTYVEFELLRTMAARPGRVFSRQALLEALWGDYAYREPRTIDVHVRHLREKLEADPHEPELILTVRGVGYRLPGLTCASFRSVGVAAEPRRWRSSSPVALAVVWVALVPTLQHRLVDGRIALLTASPRGRSPPPRPATPDQDFIDDAAQDGGREPRRALHACLRRRLDHAARGRRLPSHGLLPGRRAGPGRAPGGRVASSASTVW